VGEVDTRAAPLPHGPVLTDGAARALDVVRWLLVGALLVDLVLGLVTVPRQADLGELQRDLAAGRVESLSVVTPSDLRSTRVLAGWPPPSDNETSVLWRVGSLGYRNADLPGDATPDQLPDVVAEADSTIPDAVGHDLPLRWPGLGAAVLLILLLTLAAGRQTRRATRWACFWIALMPLSAGLFWLLLREAPWSRAARVLPVPAPHRFQPGDTRLTGGHALGWLVLACLVGQFVLYSLGQRPW